jgi:hypothetical protein
VLELENIYLKLCVEVDLIGCIVSFLEVFMFQTCCGRHV